MGVAMHVQITQDTKVRDKQILSFLVAIARYVLSTQNSDFARSLQYQERRKG